MLDKALITRADDFGSSHSANQAIYEVSKKGIVKNVSVMACAPYLEEAAEICLKESFLDLFEGKEVQGELELPPFGTKVFARKK